MRLSSLVALGVSVCLCLAAGPSHADSGAMISAPVGAPTNQPDVANGALTLRDALARTLLHNPELSSAVWEVRAREAAALQAGLLPNPELAFEMANVAGQNEFQGVDAAETTLQLSQLIELGGDRKKRRQAASLEQELAGWDYETRKLDLLTGAAQAFYRVLAAQERLKLAEELTRLAQEVRRTAGARVEAGKVAPVEEIRAQVSLSSARIEEDQASRELQAARRALGAFWRDADAAFSTAVGDLRALESFPPAEGLPGLLAQNPDLARWETELAQREAALGLEKARRIPDLTVGLGVRNFQESDANALVLGVSVPLPLFDRNQGGIRAAAAGVSRAREEREAARLRAGAALAESWHGLAAAHAAATTLEKEILPAAHEAFESARYGYQQGKFGFLEVLDAQRTLFEVRRQHIDTLVDYHSRRAEVERLLGRSLADQNPTNHPQN